MKDVVMQIVPARISFFFERFFVVLNIYFSFNANRTRVFISVKLFFCIRGILNRYQVRKGTKGRAVRRRHRHHESVAA